MEYLLDLENEAEFFGPLYPYVVKDDITDIDYNGYQVWLTDCKNQRFLWEGGHLSKEFVLQFTQRVSNGVSKPFHKQEPVLEAQTDKLRITVVHESVANTGRCISIRKSLPYVRLREETMVQEGYITSEVLALLKQCVKQRKNMVFCGEPGVGKTECAKFFSGYIAKEDRVITIEDTPEWHYATIHPQRDCVELQVTNQLDYAQAIKTCLRLNPKWMMLSETRSREVVHLLESLSTGVKGMTTLHTDDVRKIPDRMLNMMAEQKSSRWENDIYEFVDVGILIRRKERRLATGEVRVIRFIEQVAFFSREQGKNQIEMVVEDGNLIKIRKEPEETSKVLQNLEEEYQEIGRETQRIKEELQGKKERIIGRGGSYGGTK